MSNTFCDITIILDRSGSMVSICDTMVTAINKLIADVDSQPGDGCWTLVQFDDRSSALGAKEDFPHVVFERTARKDIPDFKLVPRGGTAMVDAIYVTVNKIKNRVSVLTESSRPKVMVVIITDGAENCSTEFNTHQLRALMAEVESQFGFSFIYLGANQDSFAVTNQYNISSKSFGGYSNKFNYEPTSVGTQVAMNCLSDSCRSWKLEGNESAGVLLSSNAPDIGQQQPVVLTSNDVFLVGSDLSKKIDVK